MSIPSRCIYEILHDGLSESDHKLEAAARLYEIFSRSEFLKSRAGYMLEDDYHKVLCKGGQWQILCMKANRPGPKYTHLEPRNSGYQVPSSWLQGTSQIPNDPITIGTHQLPDDTPYTAPPLREYQPLPVSPFKLSLIDGTFKFPLRLKGNIWLIYLRSDKTATIFQATVSRTNSVKQGWH